MPKANQENAQVVTDADHELVTQLLGREPQGLYTIAVRRGQDQPAVIENSPFLFDGRPMPTRYWLIDPILIKHVGRIESAGGVDLAESEIGLAQIAEIHRSYEAERDSHIPDDWDGPKPSGGVGGTRIGVKCLHAHLANYLVSESDLVGEWVRDKLGEEGISMGDLNRLEDLL